MNPVEGFIIGFLLDTTFAAGSYYYRKLDKGGAIAGFLLGLVIIAALGLEGFMLLVSFFGIGVAATRIKYDHKHRKGAAQTKGGVRSAWNVVANGGFPGLWAVIGASVNEPTVMGVWFTASLAAATADTLESEIGVLSKTPPRLITTGRPVLPGTDGGISVLGTGAGIAGAIIMASIGYLLGLIPFAAISVVAGAAFVATVLESLIAALLKTSGEFQGHLMNLFTTGSAGIIVGILLALTN